MPVENAFKLGSILLLVGFSIAGANLTSSALAVETIHSESQVSLDEQQSSILADLKSESDIRTELEAVEEINQMNVTKFTPYKIQ